MSLIEVLCWLREALPLPARAAPKRVLLEHQLLQEHALLRQPWLETSSSANPPGYGRTSHTTRRLARRCLCLQQQGKSRRCKSARYYRSSSPGSGDGYTSMSSAPLHMVEELFRKARLRRCFVGICQQRGGSENGGQSSVAPKSPPGLVVNRAGIATAQAGDTNEEMEQGSAPDNEAVFQPEGEFCPRLAVEASLEPRSQHLSDSPRHRDAGEAEDERARRQFLLRGFSYTASRQNVLRRDDHLDLGQGGAPVTGGAPCFTVGESRWAQTGPGDHDGVGLSNAPEGVRLRRANLLRRILHAMRESARERVREAEDTSPAPTFPISRGHVSQPTLLPISKGQTRIQNPPVSEPAATEPTGALSNSTPTSERDFIARTVGTSGDLPVHPREAASKGEAYQAVFKALLRLIPQSPTGEARVEDGGGGGVAAAGGGAGRMQAAAVRCGIQCQGYIRALQKGMEVAVGPFAAVSEARFKLVLEAVSIDGTGAALVLHDIDARPEAAAVGSKAAVMVATGATEAVQGVARDVITSNSGGAPPPKRIPLARVTRVRCIADGTATTSGESLSFVILETSAAAVGTFSGARAEGEQPASSREVLDPLRPEKMGPFGMLRATSREDFQALVLGIASIKSALDSPFRTRRQASSTTGTTGEHEPGGVSHRFGSPAPAGLPAVATTAAAVACLPWQGARVCIAELAPSLTFLGAVRTVEAEARRVGLENGVSLRDQNLLICADLW